MIQKSPLFAMWPCTMIIPSLRHSLHSMRLFPSQTYLTSVPNRLLLNQLRLEKHLLVLLVLLLLRPQPRTGSPIHSNKNCSLQNPQQFSNECYKAKKCPSTNPISKPASQPSLQTNPISTSVPPPY